MAKNAVKVTFLEEINRKKQILFGALTPQVTKQTKQKAWQEIYTTAASLGVVLQVTIRNRIFRKIKQKN
jgi:hypothetical protein